MSFFKYCSNKPQKTDNQELVFNYHTFNPEDNISATELSSIVQHEEKMAALNQQLRMEIQNKPLYFKYLIGEDNIRAFLETTSNRPNKGIYEKLHAKMVAEGQTHCSDYQEHPDVQITAYIIGFALCIGGLSGLVSWAMSMCCCAATLSEATSIGITVGSVGAITGGCGSGFCLSKEINGREFRVLQEHREEIAAYAKQFQETYLNMMKSYQRTQPEKQTMEDNPQSSIKTNLCT